MVFVASCPICNEGRGPEEVSVNDVFALSSSAIASATASRPSKSVVLSRLYAIYLCICSHISLKSNING